jgi:hypothetical protein
MKTRTPHPQGSLTLRPVRPSVSSSPHAGCELRQLLTRYGPDALQPRYLSFLGPDGEEEIVLVPKLRYEMGEKAWEALGVEEKGVITASFYTTL